jgi:hypothetical protein
MTPKKVVEHLQSLLSGARNVGGSMRITLEEGESYELIDAVPGIQTVVLSYIDGRGGLYSTELGTARHDPRFVLSGMGLRGLDIDGEPVRVVVSSAPSRRDAAIAAASQRASQSASQRASVPAPQGGRSTARPAQASVDDDDDDHCPFAKSQAPALGSAAGDVARNAQRARMAR